MKQDLILTIIFIIILVGICILGIYYSLKDSKKVNQQIELLDINPYENCNEYLIIFKHQNLTFYIKDHDINNTIYYGEPLTNSSGGKIHCIKSKFYFNVENRTQ